MKKLAIICGDLPNPRSLIVFQGFCKNFQLTACLFRDEKNLDYLKTFLQIKLFDRIQDMHGYMRNLEEEIGDQDALIVVDSTRLSSFQALKISQKMGMPIFVYTSEYKPFFYENCLNIKALQKEIFRNSNLFFTPSKRCTDLLLLEGVKEEKVHTLPPLIEESYFEKIEEHRKKFRTYIGIQETDRVLLYTGPMEPENHPDVIVHALKILQKNQLVDLSTVKVIFAGNGSLAKKLKYLTYDSGFGDRFYFIHQETFAFAKDLFAASDVMVFPKNISQDIVHSFPYEMIEAMACGVVCIGLNGSIHEDLAKEVLQIVEEGTPEALAYTLKRIFAEKEILPKLKADTQGFVRKQFSLENFGFDEAMNHCMKYIEVQFKNNDLQPSQKAELACLRAEALVESRDYESSVAVFEEAISYDEHCFRAYRGLGSLAYLGHSNEEAVVFFKKALALNINDGHSLLGMGLIYRRIGLFPEALIWLEKAVFNSNEDIYRKSLPLLLQSALDCPNAELVKSILERMVELLGEEPKIMMALAQIYLKLGFTEKGTALIEKYFVGADH